MNFSQIAVSFKKWKWEAQSQFWNECDCSEPSMLYFIVIHNNFGATFEVPIGLWFFETETLPPLHVNFVWGRIKMTCTRFFLNWATIFLRLYFFTPFQDITLVWFLKADPFQSHSSIENWEPKLPKWSQVRFSQFALNCTVFFLQFC